MAKINMKENPFFLDEEAQEWVLDTWKKMSLEQKCGQVFCPMGLGNDPELLKHLTQDIGVGGLMYRADTTKNIQQTHRMLQEFSDIPLLLAANTEAGGDGLALEGTSFGKPMAVAATNNPENGYRMGLTACKEGAALGLNWSFAPIVDINYDFHNPITNVRTFGSDPEKVLAFASRYLDAADECDVAVAIKHFPGDGVDERDQHILTSVNSFSTEKWDETFGYVYSNLIQKGAKTVMVGHIAQPAYVKAINPNATRKEMLCPASLSPELLTGLLRGKLGFNGLISTDATPMVGFTAAMKRCEAIPQAIAAGCDMILFNKSLEEDYGYLLTAVKEGKVSEERLDEAVLRILATKASLHLQERKRTKTLVPGEEAIKIVGCQTHKTWAKEVADQAITLVRDNQNLLPISPKKYKRVYLNVIQKDSNPDSPFVQKWKAQFEKEGFEVTVRDRRTAITVEDFIEPERMTPEKGKLMHEMYRSVEEMKQDYDLYVYICNMENASNNTTLRLNWNVCFGLGDDAPWFVSEIPTMMISTAYPFHLFDAPMIDTYINSYSGNPEFIQVTMEKIMGRSEFCGVSPVDALCGKDYI
ncbi:glycoside hydrolase family 3 protein [Mediterraneibacter faecis]|uniref:glycoside hydrolase family 3 protein n=1 Tax=Mediterraneibacter faecis TaxID=592978 RepID=UPI0022E3118E|nr:glycoside hydrolase family 3 N-terminal domain-containing protein [Mediterraneibacter faecis]